MIETLGCRRRNRATGFAAKHARGGWAKARPRLSPGALKGESPRACSAGRCVCSHRRAGSRVAGQIPESAAGRSAWATSVARINGLIKTECGSIRRVTGAYRYAMIALKGESHERRRFETEPARDRRAETVERVVKPCGRTEAGRDGLRDVDLRSLHVLKGTEAHERRLSASAGGLGIAGIDSKGRLNSLRGWRCELKRWRGLDVEQTA